MMESQMRRPIYSAYVFMLGDRYLKFGSYSSARLVENPLGASLYVSVQQANKRFTEIHDHGIWIEGEERKRTSIELHTLMVKPRTSKVDQVENETEI